MIRTEVDVAKAIARLRGGGKAIVTLQTEVFPRLKEPMRADQREHARRAMGPEGPWQQRSAASTTRAMQVRRLGGGGGRMTVYRKRDPRRGKLLGKLGNATTVRARGLAVVGKSMVPWASIHQDGGIANRGARIPARPFLWISDDLADLATRSITNHLLEALK